jgi:hypothetical protein
MKLILLLILIFFSQRSISQVSHWIISINNKIVLTGSDSVIKENPATIQIDRTQILSDTFLQIEINEPVSNIQWVRAFVFSSATESSLLIKKFDRSNGKFSIPFTEILTNTRKEKKLSLYTEQHPANPDSGIRSKRTLLAIMELK